MSLPKCNHVYEVFNGSGQPVRKTQCEGVAEPSGYCFRHERKTSLAVAPPRTPFNICKQCGADLVPQKEPK